MTMDLRSKKFSIKTSTKRWIASRQASSLSLISTHNVKNSPAYLLYTSLCVCHSTKFVNLASRCVTILWHSCCKNAEPIRTTSCARWVKFLGSEHNKLPESTAFRCLHKEHTISKDESFLAYSVAGGNESAREQIKNLHLIKKGKHSLTIVMSFEYIYRWIFTIIK